MYDRIRDIALREGKVKSLITRKYKSLFFVGTTGMIAEYLVLLSDNMIAGHILGKKGLATLSLVYPFFNFTIFITILLSFGVSICALQEVGKMNRERANELFSSGVIVCLAIGYLISLIAFAWKRPLLDLMGVPIDVYVYALEYYKGILWLPVLFPVSNLLYEAISNDGSERLATVASIVQVVSNIVFSIILCQSIGVRGIAIGTLASMAINILICCLHFFKKSNEIHFRLRLSWKDFCTTLRYSFGDASVYLYTAIFGFIVNLYITKQYGTDMIVAFFVVANMQALVVSGLDGAANAVQSLISLYTGERNLVAIRCVMGTALKFALTTAAVICVGILLFGRPIEWAMGIREGEAAVHALEGIWIFAPSCFFSAILQIYSAYFLSSGKVWVSVYLNALLYLVFQIGLSLLLSNWLGMRGIWIGILLAPICTILVGVLTLKLLYPKTSLPLCLNKEEEAKWFYATGNTQSANFMAMVQRVELFLREKQLPTQAILRAVLLIEEMCIAVAAQNKGKVICLDCSVHVGTCISLIFRDEGQPMNLTAVDGSVSSLQSFLTSSILESYNTRHYLRATGFNRSTFAVPIESVEKGCEEQS